MPVPERAAKFTVAAEAAAAYSRAVREGVHVHAAAETFACDANGNVSDYVSSNGASVSHVEYDPFGNTLSATGPLSATFPHRFSTKYLDAETGLYYYGYRYYSPTLGRWLSRDPIGNRGGRNLYGYTRNNPSTYWDYLGLVAVTHDHPDPAKVAPEMAGNEFFSSRDFWQPWETPDPMSIGGWTGYQDKKVKCGCDCVTNQQGKITGWTMSCTVSWKARIVLNSGWKKGVPWDEPLSLTGAFGHEQRHVQGAIKLVDKKVVEPLRAKDGSFVAKARCTSEAARWAHFYGNILNSTLDPRVDHHRNRHPGDDAYSDEPNDGERYEPLPNSPSIP